MATKPADGLRDRAFLILHGWQNRRPRRHWQHRLARHLARLGADVRYPQLPDPDRPAVQRWVETIDGELRATSPERLTVICHSLACMAWMHLSDHGDEHLPVHRLLFVAPPGPRYLAGVPDLVEFLPPASPAVVGKSALTQPRLACADGDPYCSPERADQVYPDVFDVDVVPGARHFDIPSGYGEWSRVLEWCEDPEVRLADG